MSQPSAAALPVTGGILIAGTAVGLQWVAVVGAGAVALGFVLYRYGHRIAAARGRGGSR